MFLEEGEADASLAPIGCDAGLSVYFEGANALIDAVKDFLFRFSKYAL